MRTLENDREQNENNRHSKRQEAMAMEGSKKREIFKVTGRLERGLDHVDKAMASGDLDITLDFFECPFITVEGLEWLEEVLLRAQSYNSDVHFINLEPSVYKVFKVARIDSLLKACGSPGVHSGPIC